MKTGEKIARLRKENNYTQEQLAALLGVSRQSVSKYESGVTYPETDKLIRLSELFLSVFFPLVWCPLAYAPSAYWPLACLP